MTAAPFAANVADQRVDVELGADIDAPRRLIQQQDRRVAGQRTGEEDLLLVAARQLGDRLVWSRCLQPHVLRQATHQPGCLSALDEAQVRQARQMRQGNRLGQRAARHHAFGPPLGGDVGQPLRPGPGGVRGQRHPAQGKITRARHRADQRPQQDAPARAGQTGHAQDLAFRHREGQGSQPARTVDPAPKAPGGLTSPLGWGRGPPCRVRSCRG